MYFCPTCVKHFVSGCTVNKTSKTVKMKRDKLSSKITFTKSKNCYDGEKVNKYLLDEFCMWDMPKGKVFKIWKIFYLYYESTYFWFRFFGGYGIWGRGKRATMYEIFSERNGHSKYFKLFGWKIKILKPSKLY